MFRIHCATSPEYAVTIPGLSFSDSDAINYFPFDRQDIQFDIQVETENALFGPSLKFRLLKLGWIGKFDFGEANKPILKLTRFGIYKWTLILFFIINTFAKNK